MHIYRKPTLQQQALTKAQSDLLDAQTMAANLYEQNQTLNSSLLDTQTMVANLVENGGKA